MKSSLALLTLVLVSIYNPASFPQDLHVDVSNRLTGAAHVGTYSSIPTPSPLLNGIANVFNGPIVLNSENPPPGLFTKMPVAGPVVKGVADTLEKIPIIGDLFAGMFYGLA
ncbi:hypothetical protein CONCODRAFT_10278 [Conidiobolus coronatus NRRL 28638]|uniref:Uncharacterized protein n=1 Tax=Conidiobolus coronatus (strain ATCC 28846 / CBS 209.66 / NRRL 28638) TaxID=796925 RepID=A0A137NY75_CONC2|nr:hypothetical protein CONCODRAFT_10278 [Conidiobolus coronatus NRRL 28638]|eukprot:KXN67621.1 hypothetical protein CONCODRAFT_10278 [Conidiobolus coronatus NRRL 28638]